MRNPKILKAYGVTEKEADEVERIVEELTYTSKPRSEMIRELRERLEGNKLIFAIGLLEFALGFRAGIEFTKEMEAIAELAEALFRGE